MLSYFQISSIIILFIFYACYFLKMLFQKKKGIQTDQIGKGKTGIVKIIETIMKFTTILVPICELISIWMDTIPLIIQIRFVGIIIAIVGDVIFIISVYTMKDSWRAGISLKDKTELVTDGIYQISRNPAFLGFDLVYIGILLIYFNWVLCVVSFCAILMFHLQIVFVEEKFLITVFGNDYLAYQNSVNRYFGRKWVC